MTRASVFTLPNLVSTSRFALALGFVAADAAPVRLALIGLASATDVLDGWLARRTKVVSTFGALLDPVADRFFVLAVVISYVMSAQLTVLQACLIMLRDVMSVIGFFVARNVSWLRSIPFQARLIGKLVTGAQLFTFLVVLLRPSWTSTCVWIVGALGLAATIDYTLMLWRERLREPAARTPIGMG
jgi:cardiolipin synthase (CMP-forming)